MSLKSSVPAVFVKGSPVGSAKPDGVSIQQLKERRRKMDIVVVEKPCGIEIICGIRATSILILNVSGDYAHKIIWPIKKGRIAKEEIIVFFNKKTGDLSYKLGKDAREIKDSGKMPKDMEEEFSYFKRK